MIYRKKKTIIRELGKKKHNRGKKKRNKENSNSKGL